MLSQSTLSQRKPGEISPTDNTQQALVSITSKEELTQLLESDNHHHQMVQIVPKEPSHGKTFSISTELLKLMLPLLAFYYGTAYSGIIARELFSYAYDYQYGIPELPCHWLNLICKAQHIGAYNEFYHVYLPLREAAGDLGRIYGPGIAAGLAATAAWVGPPATRLSFGVISKIAQSLGRQVSSMAKAFYIWGYDLAEQLSELQLEERAPIKETEPLEIVAQMEQIDKEPQNSGDFVIDMSGVDFDPSENYWDSKVLLQFTHDERTIEALALEGYETPMRDHSMLKRML